MILLRMGIFFFFALVSFFFFFPLSLWFYICSELCTIQMRTSKKKKIEKERDKKNGLIINWQIPTSSLEKWMIFSLVSFRVISNDVCWETWGLHKICSLQNFQFLNRIRLGEEDFEIEKMENKKNKNLKLFFSGLKIYICSGFVYYIHEYVFEKN